MLHTLWCFLIWEAGFSVWGAHIHTHLWCSDRQQAHSPNPPLAALVEKAWLVFLAIQSHHHQGTVSAAGQQQVKSAISIHINLSTSDLTMCVWCIQWSTAHLASWRLSRVLVNPTVSVGGSAAAQPCEVPADGGLGGAGLLHRLRHDILIWRHIWLIVQKCDLIDKSVHTREAEQDQPGFSKTQRRA